MSGWTPGAHGSRREAYQTGREGAPIARPEAVEGVAVGGSRCRCCGCLNGGEVVGGGGVFVTSFNKQARKKINILQKSYIKIWLYNVFVVPLQCVNKTNV